MPDPQKVLNIVHPEEPITTDILAQAIVDLDVAAKKILASGLRRRTLLLLLQDSSGVNRGDIDKVLDALKELRQRYTTR